MRKYIQHHLSIALACLLFAAQAAAQTNPTARAIPFTEAFPAGTFSAYPSGFQGWSGLSGATVSTQELAEASAPNANGALSASAPTSGGAGGLFGSAGRVAVNTSSNSTAGVNQLMMAINATNRLNLTVGYGVYSVLANPRTIGVVCQYRIGTTGTWTSINPDSGLNPYSQTSGTTGLKTTVTSTLPASCDYQPVVQVRWAIWRGTETGNSSALGFDNISVGGTLDTDHDGDPDSTDPCPLLANLAPGYGCDDGNPNTDNDVITAGCVCVGTVANDECGSATNLGGAQPFGTCSPTSGNTSGANPTASVSCGGTTAKDVWYQFYMNYTSHAFIDLVPGTAVGLGIEVFELDCSGSVVYCASGTSHLVPVTAGQWHYVRVFSTTPGTFSICVSEPVSNDDCANATSFGYGQPFGNCSPTDGTTLGATAEDTPACAGGAVTDVWYSALEGYNNSHALIDLIPGSASGMGIEVHDGSCAGAITYCGTGNSHVVPVVQGQYIYIRVFSTTPGTFSICRSRPVDNDDCANATGLGYGQPFGSCSPTDGTTLGATAEDTPACAGGAVTDVWYYSSEAYNNSHALIDLIPGTASGMGVEVHDGSCGGAIMYCGTGNSHVVPITPGQYIYIRVFSSTPGTFSICRSRPVDNDDCVNATSLDYGQAFGSCSPTDGTTSGATADDTPACAGGAVTDVWYYSYEVYNNSHALIDLIPGSASGMGIEVHDGSCGGAITYCGTGNNHVVPITPGQAFYIRVFSSTPGTFSICRSRPVDNDDCANATYLGGAQQAGACSPTQGNTAGATLTGLPTCGGPSTTDVWYYFYPSSSTYTFIDLNSGNPSIIGVEVFSNSCTGTSIYCGSGGDHMVATTSGIPYYVRVFSTTPAPFSICVSAENPYDDCVNAPGISLNTQGNCPANATAGTTQNAQQSPGGTCGSGTEDVWYQVSSGSATAMLVGLTSTGASGLGIQVLSGGCGGALVYCGTGLSHGFVTDPGTTYWIRVFSAVEGGFTICASQTSGSPDCLGVPGGPATPGQLCEDNNPDTYYSIWQPNCSCLGYDCAGVPNGPGIPGTACDDSNPCTINDTWAMGCSCVGTPLPDGDGDGICDQEDDCPSVYGEIGWGCDDGDPVTPSSHLNANCVCEGNDCTGTPSGTNLPGTSCTAPYASPGNAGTWGVNCGCYWTDCNGNAQGSAYVDDCGVCAAGNTGLVPNASCADCAGVPYGLSEVDGCGTCRLPNDPAFEHTYQTMAFSGNAGFTTGLVQPTTGAPTTVYTSQVLYTNSANTLPSYGYPRLILDYEGNGSFNDQNDRAAVMTPVDLNDLNTADGKLYTATITGLAVGTAWQARIQAFAGICVQDFGPFDQPDVLLAPDLQIFANDITFSALNPAVNSPLTVKAAVHNVSDYPIVNPVVHLVNQFAPGSVYGDVTLPTLPPHSTDTAVWFIITPSQVAWCPMQVVVDPANTIAESNELNNTAVRPFINGPYNLPGGIHVYAQVSPEVSYVTPNYDDFINIYGHAYYYGTAIPLQDSSVAGATVTLLLPQGGTATGHTDENGYFNIPILALDIVGTFDVTGTITDYTLIGDLATQYTRIQAVCMPDLQASVVFDVPGGPVFPGQSVDGHITVYNVGCGDVTVSTTLYMSQDGGTPAIPNAVIPPLAAGTYHIVPFSGLVFNSPGTYSVCGTADGANEVAENSENNTDCEQIVVTPLLPDLYMDQATNAGGTDCGTIQQPAITIRNGGYTAAGAFDVRVLILKDNVLVSTHTESVSGLAINATTTFSTPYQMSTAGAYTYQVDTDHPLPNGTVAEVEENNNTTALAYTVVACGRDLYPVANAGPALSIGLCLATEQPTFDVANLGLLPTGDFDVRVEVSVDAAPVGTFIIPVAGLAAQSSTTLTVPFNYTTTGVHTFDVSCDVPLPNGVVVESDETNNTYTYTATITECLPELSTSLLGCNEHTVAPTDPQYPGTVTYTGILLNTGDAAAVDPVMRFAAVPPGSFTDVTYTGTLAPGASTVLSVTVASVAPATADLVLTADPDSLIEEHDELNNSVSGAMCWEFAPVPLSPPCGWNFWDSGYGRNQPIPMYVGVSVSHLYWASQLKVRFTVSGPGVSGTVVLGDAILENIHQLCYCPYVAALPNSFIPPLGGTYHFEMIVDPDGEYTECNENDNVLTADVVVVDQPDMRVLSQYINPSLLNPEVDEPITFDLTYENIGTGNLSDLMDMRVLIDEQEVATITDLPGLLSGTNNTVAMPGTWSSDLVGIHIMRIIIDSEEEVDESNELNNEATRAFIVGESSNLYFASFTASDLSPALGSTVTLNAIVSNNGDLPNNGQVWFYRVLGADTTFLSASNIDVVAGGSVAFEVSYSVSALPTTILARIQQVEFLEFNDTDNEAVVHLGAFDVAVVSSQGCTGVSLGSLTASASGGTGPYTYLWSNGSVGTTMQGAAGTYSLTVTDALGQIALANGTIENDPNCTTAPVLVSLRAALEGPYNSTTGLMNDALRLLPTFPHTDPYPALGYTHVGPGNLGTVSGAVTATTGNDAIVDWVLVELRNSAAPTSRVATRSALLQRDGDVVALDGVSPVGFAVPAGNYQVAVRHRNHLGCMTLDPVALSTVPTAIDLRNPGTATYGTAARKSSGGAIPVQLLWAGDVTFSGQLKYTGSGNDRDPILITVGSTTPNNVVSTYSTRDVDLNGQVKYTGSGNDRDRILVNVGSTTPNNVRVAQLP